MDAEKIRNMTDAELQQQERDLNDQLFRLKFQLKMGQTESLKKIRGLRKDVARIKTVMREKQLATGTEGSNGASATATATTTRPAKKTTRKK
jgi:large subunit ribosomal protein L29